MDESKVMMCVLGFLGAGTALLIFMVVVCLSLEVYHNQSDASVCKARTGLYSGCKLKEKVETHNVNIKQE